MPQYSMRTTTPFNQRVMVSTPIAAKVAKAVLRGKGLAQKDEEDKAMAELTKKSKKK